MKRGATRASWWWWAVLVAALLAACTDPPPVVEPPRPTSVLLLTIDTLRADKLGAYGYPLETSPHIDELARQGVVFRDVTVQWPKTWPSMASLFTGAYPKTTGMRLVPRRLPDSSLLLSEIFAEAGYECAAIVSNFNLGTTTGFHQGFAYFAESWLDRWSQEEQTQPLRLLALRVKEYLNATLVTDQALSWLRGRDGSRPFFLWVHYMDPHGPYVPPGRYRELFEGEHPSSPIPLDKLPPYQRQTWKGSLITDLAFYTAQYDREVRYLDDEIGRLFEGLPDNVLVVFTADHGESLGEHEYYLEHGMLSYQPTAQVPLIFSQPGSIEGGRTVETPVGLIDVTPTIVELVGLEVPGTFEGNSLALLLRGTPGAAVPEYVFMESGYHPKRPQLTVRHGRWKLIQVQAPEDRALMSGGEYELYDLEADPGEMQNLAERHPEIVERLSRALAEWYAVRAEPVDLGTEIDLDALDEKSREMLRALGYLQDDR